MRKYGIDKFQIELIEETDNPEEREVYWIEYYQTYAKGYNATKGGDGKRFYDHEAIVQRLKEHPYTSDIAKEFDCSQDLVCRLARNNNIKTKNKSNEALQKLKSKPIAAYSKDGEFIKDFPSTVEAAKWCYETKKASTLTSGVRSHIGEVANGTRKSAYGYIWKYIS